MSKDSESKDGSVSSVAGTSVASKPAPAVELSPNARLILEVLGCLLIMVAALVPRMRDFGAGFDRGITGQQGAFFALAAVNYQRVGVSGFNGYPIQNIDAVQAEGLGTSSVSLFANHPPAVPLAAWLAAKWMGPSGWDDAWKKGDAPEGLEPALRFPFLIAHLASLVLFYLAIRTAAGSRRAMLALAILAATPISILYSTQIGAENPALACLSAAALFHIRYLRSGRKGDLIGFGLSALFGGATGFAFVFFLPGFLLQAFLRDKPRSMALATSGSIGLFVPLAMHVVLSRGAVERIGLSPLSLSEQLGELLSPLSNNDSLASPLASSPMEQLLEFYSLPIIIIGLMGALLAVILALRSSNHSSSNPRSSDIDPTLPLAFGGLLLPLVALLFSADDGERASLHSPLLLFATLGIAASGALVFDSLAQPLAKLRGGIAPLVVAASLVALPGLERANALRRLLRDPGPHDDASLTTGSTAPLPITTGREIAALIPAGDLAMVPPALGLTATHQYYAWRTLLSVDLDDAGSLTHGAAAIDQREQSAWVLLPRDTEEEFGTLSAALLDRVRASHPGLDWNTPDRQSEFWRVWRLSSD